MEVQKEKLKHEKLCIPQAPGHKILHMKRFFKCHYFTSKQTLQTNKNKQQASKQTTTKPRANKQKQADNERQVHKHGNQIEFKCWIKSPSHIFTNHSMKITNHWVIDTNLDVSKIISAVISFHQPLWRCFTKFLTYRCGEKNISINRTPNPRPSLYTLHDWHNLTGRGMKFIPSLLWLRHAALRGRAVSPHQNWWVKQRGKSGLDRCQHPQPAGNTQ